MYWKIYFILIALCVLGVVAVFPYIMTVQKDVLSKVPLPFPVFFTVQLIQSTVIFSLAILIGLTLADKSGFKFPLLDAIVSHKKISHILVEPVNLSVALGIFSGLAITALDYVFNIMGATISVNVGHIPAWQRLLVAIYGGINEEVIMRLFLMSLLVFIGMKITRKKTPSSLLVWTVIIITSIIFGLGHLPITASITHLTTLVIARAIVLNGVGGIIFAWLYWKKGLEYAMIAHFTADILIHFVIPLLIGM